MESNFTYEPMLDMFLFETSQLIEQLEENILTGEKESRFTQDAINEIFRIMHTIKGSAAMMLYQNISTLAHSMEDIFFFLREQKPSDLDYSTLSDLVLDGIDFIKFELEKIKSHGKSDGNADLLIHTLAEFLISLKKGNESGQQSIYPQEAVTEKQKYYISQSKTESAKYSNFFKAVIFFEEGCEMENIRAYTIVHNLKDIPGEFYYTPEDIIDHDESIHTIRNEGFCIYLKTDESASKMKEFFEQTIFLKSLDFTELTDDSILLQFAKDKQTTVMLNPVKVPELSNAPQEFQMQSNNVSAQQTIISVNVAKLDKLMDLVGEMVIAEAMVIQNPDLAGLELGNFQKASRQLNKITSELQDMVMSIRMVPLSTTFHKMNRIIRDMCRKLGKEAELVIIGEETEVDKNIIEHISDPLMHLVRNSIDHGLGTPEERMAAGKPKNGTVTIEAKNAGSDVLIMVKDDGRGLDKKRILAKAMEQSLICKNENEMTDKEIYSLILLPGFSTKENVTEFSGRGVGMDVVAQNIEMVGGSLSVDSSEGMGTTITMKIPLTLAIIDGMNVKVGGSYYTVPTVSIKESFRPKENNLITDPDGNEMIMVRGKCYRIQRLHQLFKVDTRITKLTKGIILMVEQEEKSICLFADEMVGQQQVVVKALPMYIQNLKRVKGISGCTLLGDGSISLILDIMGLIGMESELLSHR